ncbi:unnamed protein product [Symbiodinium sp. CCMP2456]|nr:unnamed protein product [Symbiodinium sp. CCMP2456]
MDGVRKDPNGELIHGKQVIRPVRFFVSDQALLIVSALRANVEARIGELRSDTETRLIDIPDSETTKIQKEDIQNTKNFSVLKAYAASLFQGVSERKQLISCKEHRSAVCYLALVYELIKIKKEAGAKTKFREWGELQGTRLRWLASYVIHSVCRTSFSRTAPRHMQYEHFD